MPELEIYLGASNSLSTAANLIKAIESARKLDGMPRICDSCIGGLEAFVKSTQDQIEAFEQGLGISVRVNDLEVLNYALAPEYSGKIAVIFDKPYQEVGALMGIKDFSPSFTAGLPAEVRDILGNKDKVSRQYETIDNLGKTIIFVPDMDLARAFILLYFKGMSKAAIPAKF